MSFRERLEHLGVQLHAAGLALGKAWRALTGEDAYARYLQHHLTHHPGSTPMDEASFWKAELDRRYQGIRRCC